MSSIDGFDRKDLTFAQAEGYEELPRQLALGELPQVAKARLWAIVDAEIDKNTVDYASLRSPMYEVAKAHFVQVEGGFADEFEARALELKKRWKKKFVPEARYVDTLDFMQWFMQRYPGNNIPRMVGLILAQERAAYRVEGNIIVPMASIEEGEALTRALNVLDDPQTKGPRKHFVDAASNITAGMYADSVRNSIHAIESLVRTKTGKRDFSAAISEIQKRQPLHGALREALFKLYGYSSDEQGIRHSLLDKGDANVSEADALFMIGVCAAFATYLTAMS